MSKTSLLLFFTTTLILTWGCGSSESGNPAPGSEVTIEAPDGSLVTGRVAEPTVHPEPPAVVPQADSFAPTPTAPESLSAAPQYEEVTVPAGTRLSLRLDTELASDVSQVEDPVQAQFDHPVAVDGVRAIPEGSLAHGTVTTVRASGRVNGRAQLAFRFDRLDINSDRYEIRSDAVSYEAESTKTEDAKTIGIGAAAGTVIGGLLGGKKGAGAGAAIGGGAGTAMVLTTAGEEVELRSGTPIEVNLAQPLVILVPKG